MPAQSRPFISQYCVPMSPVGTPLLTRYNPQLQLSEVLIAQEWKPAALTPCTPNRETRITLVGRETTDDT